MANLSSTRTLPSATVPQSAMVLGTPLTTTPPNPLVALPPRLSTAQMFVIADGLDKAMYRATAKIGERDTRGFLASPVPPLLFLGTGFVSIVAIAAIGIGLASEGNWYAAGKVVPGALAAVSIPSAMMFPAVRARHRPRDPSKVEPFAKAYAEGDRDTRALVGAIAGRWNRTVRARGVAGEAARQKLGQIAADAEQDKTHSKTIDAIATIVTLLRDNNGRSLTKVTNDLCNQLIAQLDRLEGPDRRDAADFVRTRLFKGERPRCRVESNAASQELYGALVRDDVAQARA